MLSNPVYIEATITNIVPDKPSKPVTVNIELNYEFNVKNDKTYQKSISYQKMKGGWRS